MPPALREEIRQRRPFPSLEEEAFLNLARTAAVVRDHFERLLAPHGISLAQYNVLRILRGAGPEGLCRNEIRDRLITRMPDVTRLLDRMEAAGWITRARGTEDRRLVSTRLTPRGKALVNSLDAAVRTEHQRRLGHLSNAQLRSLIELLTLVRREP
ncbi:MAG TPA: MarR family transcriptional regulator [Gemmatimonadales bacterium]|nr:MarR family transcriptional regulator [Gemmatimonadales bacterium]